MATNIDQLRIRYNALPTYAHKKKFIDSLAQQIRSSGNTNKEYTEFLVECIQKYKTEISGNNGKERRTSRHSNFKRGKTSSKSASTFNLHNIVKMILIGLLIIVVAIIAIKAIGYVIQIIIGIVGVALFILIIIISNSDGSSYNRHKWYPTPDYPPPDYTLPQQTKSKLKRVNISDIWYDVSDGWAGKLELHEYMKKPKYFAQETMTDGVFFVHDKSERKIGEFDIRYMECKGSVKEIEIE